MAKKKPELEEEITDQPHEDQPHEEITLVDVFIPCHFVDWTFFGGNIKAILDEVPVRKLFIGCNNPSKEDKDNLIDYLSHIDERIQFIDQVGIKTLGMQIVDLMKRCQTEFFVFCHADARPTTHSFYVLCADMERDVGIVESERIQYAYGRTDFPTEYPYYHYRDRSFSGYQLFRKKAVEHFFDRIEDDYIYRNEDIIWQNVCTENGYRYVKSFSLHIHTCSNVNHRWTPQGIELSTKEARAVTFDMQVKGLVKYCAPTELAVNAWRDAIGICCKENKLDLFGEHFEYIKKTNPAWIEPVKKAIVDLLMYFVWRG